MTQWDRTKDLMLYVAFLVAGATIIVKLLEVLR